MKISILGQARGWDVLVLIKFICIQRFLPSFFSQISCPIFIMVISLYSHVSMHPSLPPIHFLGNPLDAYPIKALLEAMREAMSWDGTV